MNPSEYCLRLSTDATSMTSLPTPGAPARTGREGDRSRRRPPRRCPYGPGATRLRHGRLRPGVARLADAHVEHVSAVAVGALHRRQHHVGRRRSAAAEHAVGAERDVEGTPRSLPFAPTMSATCVPWPRSRPVGVRMRHRLPARVALFLVVVVPDEVVALCDAAACTEAAAEVGIVVVDPGVDHRHVDAAARVAEPALRDVRADHRQREREVRVERLGAHVERDRFHRVHRGDAVEAPDLRRRRLWGGDRDAVEQVL